MYLPTSIYSSTAKRWRRNLNKLLNHTKVVWIIARVLFMHLCQRYTGYSFHTSNTVTHSLGQTSTFDIVSQTKVSASCYADCSFHTSNTIHIVWYRHGHLTWCFLSSKEQKFHRKANSRPDMPELDICIRRTLVTQSQKHGSLYQEAYSFSSSEFRWRVWFI